MEKLFDFELENIYKRQENINFTIPEKLAVIGCGGVGNWVALFGALIGISTILLMDDDIIESHNLNRTIYCEYHIGMKKVEALKMIIEERRSNCKVIAIDKMAENEDFEKLHQDGYIIIDCRDYVDLNTDYSPVIGGYNEESITLELHPRSRKHWNIGMRNEYGAGSYLCPPVFIANMIIYLITHKAVLDKYSFMCRTFTLKDLMKAIENL